MNDRLLVINKPIGCTSMDVIRQLRKKLNIKKIGHAGTLDPLATGVLIICTGKFTKKITNLINSSKKYHAIINLSAFSETDDAEGPLENINIEDKNIPDINKVSKILKNFTGDIEQTPPKYSAIKVNGQRAYKLARSGQEVELKPRVITISEISLKNYSFPNLEIEISCSKGTYIRSLARDIGVKLNTGGYLSKLTRTAVGEYTLDQAQKVSEV